MNIVRDLRSFEQLETAWEGLVAREGNPVLGYEFFRAWAGCLERAATINVMLAGGSTPAAIAPLCAENNLSGRLRFIGAEMFDTLDFLYNDHAAVRDLADALAETGRPLYLHQIPEDSPVIDALRNAYRRKGLVIRRRTGGAPFIPLDESWRCPEDHLNAGRRGDLRRSRRLAARIGELTVDILSPGPSELQPLLEEAMRVEASGWKAATHTAIALDPLQSRFIRSFAAMAARNRRLRICFLRISGTAIATQIALENKSRFSLLKMGYDERYARLSPGILLTLETIRYSAEKNLEYFDFNGKCENWTQIWTSTCRPFCTLRIFPFNPRGFLAFAGDSSRFVRNRLSTLARKFWP